MKLPRIFAISLLTLGLHFSGDSQLRSTEEFKHWERSLVFSLVLGDYFQNDSADIFIAGHLIFRSVKLTSNPSDGCADVIVDVHKDDCGEYRAGIFRGDSIRFKAFPEIVKVKIVFNGTPFEYMIDPKNGKYALFQKETASQLVFRQGHRQPTFE